MSWKTDASAKELNQIETEQEIRRYKKELQEQEKETNIETYQEQEEKPYKASYVSKVGNALHKAKENVKERALEKIENIGHKETKEEKEEKRLIREAKYAAKAQNIKDKQSESHEKRKEYTSAKIKAQFRVKKQPKVSKSSKQTTSSGMVSIGSMGLYIGGSGHPVGQISSTGKFMSIELNTSPKRIERKVKRIERLPEPDFGQSFSRNPSHIKTKKSTKYSHTEQMPDFGQKLVAIDNPKVRKPSKVKNPNRYRKPRKPKHDHAKFMTRI